MQIPEDALTNHVVTICLQGGEQKRFKFHLHDTYSNSVHTLIVDFRQITGIYDHIQLSS